MVIMKKTLIEKIVRWCAFFDRWYNRKFNSKNCIQIEFVYNFFDYNDIITVQVDTHEKKYRYLCNKWYVLKNKQDDKSTIL